ncbi:MAG: NfeD family protein [Elusimicrobiaceae bacterium]|nr:NfeD family protein [Elusimicrobiaceae bacterium]
MSFVTWTILGVVLFIGEIFTMDFSLSCIGLGFLSAAIMAYLGFGINVQLIAVGIVWVTLFFTLRPFILKHLVRKQEYKSNMDALVGTKHNFYALKEDKKHALIKIDGDVWEAESAAPLTDGKPVKVIKVEGATLIIKQEE